MGVSGFDTCCAWCGLVKSGDRWLAERRHRAVCYTHGICQACRSRFFGSERPPRVRTTTRRGVACASGAHRALVHAAWLRVHSRRFGAQKRKGA